MLFDDCFWSPKKVELLWITLNAHLAMLVFSSEDFEATARYDYTDDLYPLIYSLFLKTEHYLQQIIKFVNKVDQNIKVTDFFVMTSLAYYNECRKEYDKYENCHKERSRSTVRINALR